MWFSMRKLSLSLGSIPVLHHQSFQVTDGLQHTALAIYAYIIQGSEANQHNSSTPKHILSKLFLSWNSFQLFIVPFYRNFKTMGFRLPGILHAKKSQVSSKSLDVPKGYLAIYVGESQKKRFIIPVSYLNLLVFYSLLTQYQNLWVISLQTLSHLFHFALSNKIGQRKK